MNTVLARMLSTLACLALSACQSGVADKTAATPEPLPPIVQACSGCHGAASLLTDLGTLSYEELLKQMRSFQQEQTPATVMGRIARGYTDPELIQIAAALSR